MLARVSATATLLFAVVALSACTAAPPAADAPRPSRSVAEGPASPSPDSWAGHFDARAAELGGAGGSVSWGEFGTPDAVSPVGWTDATLIAGDHIVAVECAGPAAVSVQLTPGTTEGGARTAVTGDVSCPGSASLAITTDVEGLTVSVDSHGEPGAYLIATDTGSASG